MIDMILPLICLLPLIRHPLSLGLVILLVSTSASLLLAKYYFYWFGYSLFLVFVGGLLVIFSYVAALAPNLKTANLKYFLIVFLFFSCLGFFMEFLVEKPFSSVFWSWDLVGSSVEITSISGLLSSRNVVLIIFLLVMLLLTMVIVVKICLYGGGPLRPFY